MGVFTGALIDAPKVYINQYSHIYHRNVFIKYITSYTIASQKQFLYYHYHYFFIFHRGLSKLGSYFFDCSICGLFDWSGY